MNSTVWKYGIIALFFILSQCVDGPLSTLHPLLNLEVETKNDTSRVIISTTVSEDHSMYRIVNDTCTLEITYHDIIDGKDSFYVDSIPTANDPEALEEGKFHGIGLVPWVYLTEFDTIIKNDTIFQIDTTKYYGDSIQIYGCVLDETEREAYASIMVYEDTSLTEIRYQTY